METAEEGGEVAEEAPIEEPGNYSVVEAMPQTEEVTEEEVDATEGSGEGADATTEALEAALDAEQATEDEAQPGELTEEQKDALETTIKVNGEERTKTVAQLKKDAELGLAAYEKMEEAAAERKQVKQLFTNLKTAGTPQLAQFLRRLGHDPVQFATELGADVLRRHEMTPEQREMEDFRAEKAHFQRQQEAAVEQQRQAQIDARTPIEQERIHGEYLSSMDQMGVPPSDKLRDGLIMRAADRQLRAFRAGVKMPSEHAVALEWEALQAVAGQQTEAMRKKRLAEAPARQAIGAKKGAPAKKKGTASPSYQTYGSGDLDAFKALLDS